KDNLSLLYVDIDNFIERAQSTLGVAAADMALSDLASLLREKNNTTDIIARFGDTAFTVLVPNIRADAAVNRAKQLCKAIEEHIIDIDNKTLQLTASIGVSLINDNTTNANKVIEQAINAMEKVRNANGNSAQLFEPEMSADERDQKNIASDLQHALDNDRF